MRKCLNFGVPIALGLAIAIPDAEAQKTPPYWASISVSKARLRTGPGRQFPAVWEYRRINLPVKVIATYPNWRKVEDPDGAIGWIQANLLSDQRTGIVRGEIRPLRASPDPSASISWRAEPGVVGKLSECETGWCRIQIGSKAGYIETSQIWGGDEIAAK